MSRIEFSREGLHNAIIMRHRRRIEGAQEAADTLKDEQGYRNRLAEWREDAYERVQNMAKRIESGEAEDAELDGFVIPSAPSRAGKYEYRRTGESVEDAKVRMEKAVERFNALPVRETYEFTAKQLEDFFGI